MNSVLNSVGNYRTTILGLGGAVLSYLIAHHIGNTGLEQTLYSLDLLLLGGAAADAKK